MSEHTPGPWFAVNAGTDDEPMMEVRAARIRGAPPRHSVAIVATGDSPQEMENANARLIAAAPEMLEALKAVTSGIYGRVAESPLMLQVRAAIAKAEGKPLDDDGPLSETEPYRSERGSRGL